MKSQWQLDKAKIKKNLGYICPWMKIISISKVENKVNIVLKGGNSDWVYSQFNRLQRKFPQYEF